MALFPDIFGPFPLMLSLTRNEINERVVSFVYSLVLKLKVKRNNIKKDLTKKYFPCSQKVSQVNNCTEPWLGTLKLIYSSVFSSNVGMAWFWVCLQSAEVINPRIKPETGWSWIISDIAKCSHLVYGTQTLKSRTVSKIGICCTTCWQLGSYFIEKLFSITLTDWCLQKLHLFN